jgi:chemotaxis protein histidine kinase CheA
MPPAAHTTPTTQLPTTHHHGKSAPWAAEVLRTVWVQQQGRVRDRLRLIERAIQSIAHGPLDEELRCAAERAAHMLAGSLGMFGFTDASHAAHRLELELAHPEPTRAPRMSALLRRIRADVQSPQGL